MRVCAPNAPRKQSPPSSARVSRMTASRGSLRSVSRPEADEIVSPSDAAGKNQNKATAVLLYCGCMGREDLDRASPSELPTLSSTNSVPEKDGRLDVQTRNKRSPVPLHASSLAIVQPRQHACGGDVTTIVSIDHLLSLVLYARKWCDLG